MLHKKESFVGSVLIVFILLFLPFKASAQTICEGYGHNTDYTACSKVVTDSGKRYLCPIDIRGRLLMNPPNCPRIEGKDVQGNNRSIRTARDENAKARK